VCDSNGFELYNNVEEEGIDIMIAGGDNRSHRHRGSKAILPQRENRRQSAKKIFKYKWYEPHFFAYGQWKNEPMVLDLVNDSDHLPPSSSSHTWYEQHIFAFGRWKNEPRRARFGE
jgi:hypothetical protein